MCPYRPVGQAGLLGQNDVGLCEKIGGVKRESSPEQHANSTGSKSDMSGILYESPHPPLVSEERCNRNYSFREAGALEKGKVGMGAPGAELRRPSATLRLWWCLVSHRGEMALRKMLLQGLRLENKAPGPGHGVFRRQWIRRACSAGRRLALHVCASREEDAVVSQTGMGWAACPGWHCANG